MRKKNTVLYCFLLFVFISCAHKKEVPPSPPLSESNSLYRFTDMGIAFSGMDNSQLLTGSHSSWTHATAAYDSVLNKFVLFYNIKYKHTLVDNRVAMRFKDPEGSFSNLVVVADRMSEGISCKTQASGIAKNGDYVSLVAHFKNSNGVHIGTSVYRSKDRGKTWSRTDMLVEGDMVKAFNGDVSGFLVLKNGRILTLLCHPVTRQTRMLYSEDNGATWTYSSIPLCYDHTEPGWCELSKNTIICYLRKSVVEANYLAKIPAYFTRSFDGGLTWELPAPSQSVLNMSSANGQLFFHAASKTVDFLHHSRFTEPDGYSSIWLSSASEADAKKDKMGEEARIVRLPNQATGGDSGYIGAAESSNGTINAFFYSGNMTNAEIHYMMGKLK